MAINPLNFVKDHLVAGRKSEEVLYEMALHEFHSGSIRPGLMAKAMAECDGNELKARALYVKLLASALRDDFYIEQRKKEELEKALKNAPAQLSKEAPEKNYEQGSPESKKNADSWSNSVLIFILLVAWGFVLLTNHL